MSLRASFLARRPALKLAGAVFALSAGLVACDSGNSNTVTTTTNGTYILTVNYSGVSGPQKVTLTDASGTVRSFNMQSGAGIADLKGIYTVDMPAVNGHTAATAQKVDLTSANQTVTFKF